MDLTLLAHNVSLWWPNMHGPSQQTLFNLTTTLTMDNAVVATVTQEIGFRTVELVGSVGNRTATHGNASLYYRVNGRPLWAKGHNWMPANVLIADNAQQQQATRDRPKLNRNVKMGCCVRPLTT